MAHRIPGQHEVFAELGGMLKAALEGLQEEGERTAEADPELLRETLEMLSRPPADPATLPPAVTPQADPDAGADPDDGTPADGGAEAGLARIAAEIAACRRCPLHRTRTRTVPGQGHPRPDLLFIGEGPGREEDRQGVPFIGPAGNLLTRLIEAMGYTREQVFIANIVKCRPTVDNAGQRDRPPAPEEMAACLPYLRDQLRHLRPRVIILLGNVPLDALFGLRGITKRRGRWLDLDGIPVMPTYHPSYLLRGGGEERARYWDVWDDMMAVLQRLGRRPPREKRRPKSP